MVRIFMVIFVKTSFTCILGNFLEIMKQPATCDQKCQQKIKVKRINQGESHCRAKIAEEPQRKTANYSKAKFAVNINSEGPTLLYKDE